MGQSEAARRAENTLLGEALRGHNPSGLRRVLQPGPPQGFGTLKDHVDPI